VACRTNVLLALSQLTVFMALSACARLPESSFELAPDSRLPKWFTLPTGVSRSDVHLTLTHYASEPSAEAVLSNKWHLTIAKSYGHVGRTLRSGHPRIGNEFDYPFYELVTINEIAEVIEHRRMEPIFSINDDPMIRQELESRTK
jgi:hypothetical protein